MKEVKFRPKIGKGDFDTKVRQVDQFIHEGHKVKVTLQFRGREMAHPELGSKILDEVLDAVGPARQGRDAGPPGGPQHVDGAAPDKKALDVEEGGGEPPRAAAGRRRADAETPTATDAGTDTPADRHRPSAADSGRRHRGSRGAGDADAD